jgi:hypothetical protein
LGSGNAARCESLAAERIMTERVLIQKDFPPVECLSSPGSSGAKA